MLSYQHIYHAGCPADVHKHMILVRLLNVLIQKERPISYMETHAGRGLYDLSSSEALKTGEAASGIEMILNKNTVNENDPYIKLIRQIRAMLGNENYYPGSPLIALNMLRAIDKVFLMELHPGEINYLYDLENLTKIKPQIHHRDGYEGVLAVSPPPIHRRGLVLIDPSYEVKSEYVDVVNFVKKLSKKWPQTVIMIWYPILAANYHVAMKRQLEEQYKELAFNEKLFDSKTGMRGSGVAIINKPWGYN